MARTKIAVIGLGMAAAPHAKSLQDLADRVEVGAVYSPSAERRSKFAETHGFQAVDAVDAIFDDASLDAVLVLTPPNTRHELVARAATAGKHVLLEKPLEISTERATAMVEAAENAGVVLQHRFRPVSVKLAEIMRSGRLGELIGASARLANWRPQSYYDQPGRGEKMRDGGGVLLTQGIHTLDLLISVAGLPVEAVGYATTTPVHAMETEDMAAGAIRFENGALGTINATTCAYPDFLDAIGTGRAPKVTGREALKVHRLIDALLRSAGTGRRETV